MERGEKRRFDADNDEGDRGRTGQASRADLAGKRKKVIGPSLPPPSATENINNEEIQENESESDSDDIGPTLPPTDSVSPKIPIGDEIPHMSKQEPIHSNETQRDKWMLQPPGSTDWTTKVDPTKLRNRRFQSGKLAKASTVGEGIDTSWTEMPGEKMKRLQDEVMGVTGPAGVNKLGTTNTSRMKGVMEKRMQEYNVSLQAMKALISSKSFLGHDEERHPV